MQAYRTRPAQLLPDSRECNNFCSVLIYSFFVLLAWICIIGVKSISVMQKLVWPKIGPLILCFQKWSVYLLPEMVTILLTIDVVPGPLMLQIKFPKMVPLS